MDGTVALATPSQNQGAPSAVGLIVGAPSPNSDSLTQTLPTGNSSLFSTSFANFISSLAKTTSGALTGIGTQIKYKGDKVLGTIQKDYYQAVSGAYGAVATGAQTVVDVGQKIETGSTLLVLAIVAFIAFPYLMAMRKK